jgi:ADP-ribose pyrophosphatase YjhB (NUDIX family)
MKKKSYIPNHAKCVFQGFLFDVYHWEQKMFDGTTRIFEAIKRIPTTQILAITKEKKIVMLSEEQPNVGKFLSVPGGQVERHETPLQATHKELLEECGMKSNNLKLWKVTNSGGKIHWESYYFIAKNCNKVQVQQSETAGEKITMSELNFKDFIKETQKPDFRNKMFQLEIYKMIKEKTLEDFKNLLLE